MASEATRPERVALDLYEAAEASGTSHTTIKDAIRDGKLRAKRLGSRRYVTPEALQEWVASWEDA